MKLIDKDALVAEIERLKCRWKNPFCTTACDRIEEIINTLEVKEVDLDAELNKWRHNHFHGRRDKEASGEYLERVSQLELAKHFFELGLKVAQKGE